MPHCIIEYVEGDGALWKGLDKGLLGFDSSPPFNLSRYLWLMSGMSQKTFEAGVLAWGKN